MVGLLLGAWALVLGYALVYDGALRVQGKGNLQRSLLGR